MLTRIEVAARRPWTPVVVVGWMALAMVAVGGGVPLTLLWAAPTYLALELLRRERPWVYLRCGRPEMAIAAARSLVAEDPEVFAPVRMAEALASLRLGQVEAAKATLAEVDGVRLDAPAQCGLFLLRGALAQEVGDVPGVTHWGEAAEAAAAASGESALVASVARFQAAARRARAAELQVLSALAPGGA